MVIPQAAREKSWHEGAGFEANANPLAFRRTIHGSCCGLWSPEREKAFSSQLRDGHLETVGCNREKSVRTIAVAAPNPFNEWMIGTSLFEMDELALFSHSFVQPWSTSYSQPLPSLQKVYQSRFCRHNLTNLDAKPKQSGFYTEFVLHSRQPSLIPLRKSCTSHGTYQLQK